MVGPGDLHPEREPGPDRACGAISRGGFVEILIGRQGDHVSESPAFNAGHQSLSNTGRIAARLILQPDSVCRCPAPVRVGLDLGGSPEVEAQNGVNVGKWDRRILSYDLFSCGTL